MGLMNVGVGSGLITMAVVPRAKNATRGRVKCMLNCLSKPRTSDSHVPFIFVGDQGPT